MPSGLEKGTGKSLPGLTQCPLADCQGHLHIDTVSHLSLPTTRCCWAHDCCYHKLKEYGCQPILNAYQFTIVNGTVTCE